MSVRTLKPNTNAQRQKSYLNNEEITKTTPEKSLVVTKKMEEIIKVKLQLDTVAAE